MKIVIDKSKCNWPKCHTGAEHEPCWVACPEKGEDKCRALDVGVDGPFIHYNQEEAEEFCGRACDSCGDCVPACPKKAIKEQKND